MGEVKVKKRKIAWGITGAGDKIAEIVEVMKELKAAGEDKVEIDVYISKAADTMLKFYRLDEELSKEVSVKLPLKSTLTRHFSLLGCKAGNTSFCL